MLALLMLISIPIIIHTITQAIDATMHLVATLRRQWEGHQQQQQ